MTIEPQGLRLNHRPLGIEHPYHQDADERFPRQPVAGQPVMLGARAWPPGAVQRVWATWQVRSDPAGNGGTQPMFAEGVLSAHAETGQHMTFATGEVRLGDGPPGDTWQVTLPPFCAGEQVTYQLHAAGAGETIDGPAHTFTTLAWTRAGAPLGWRESGGGVEIFFAAAGLCPETVLDIRLIDEGQIDWTLRAVTEPGMLDTLTEPLADRIELTDGPLRLTVHLSQFHLSLRRGEIELLTTGALPEWLCGQVGDLPTAVRLSFNSPLGEGFYGLGERFHAFNQRGFAPDVNLFEQYKNQGIHTYIPVPFLLSSRGYGFYLKTARFSNFDLAASDSQTWSCRADLGLQASIRGHIYAGDGPLENVRRFVRQTGLPKLPPDWAFGPWMSSNEWNSQKIVMEQVRLTLEHDIPASVLVIEAWSDETTFYIWNDARYKAKPSDQPLRLDDFTFPADGKWPDPKAMTDALHQQGIRLVLWQNPVMKYIGNAVHAQRDLDEAYMLEQGYHLHWADGSPYRIRPFWFRHSLLVDMTNPSAVDWWMAKRDYLLNELGVDGFKTDGGEHLWGRDVLFYDGMRGDEGQNLYANLYVGAYHRFASQKRADTLTFSRAGFTGAQAFPCHWAGDENSTWEAFRASLQAGLNAGLSGVPFWGWDIAGFSGEIPSADLYLRATAMAAFCPIMQYHSEFNDHRLPLRDRTPWNIAERTGQPEVLDIYRTYAKLRMRLMPYIIAEARHCAETGEPMMRPLFLDWPEDPQCWLVEDQYSFGRALLVAPVLEPGVNERQVYLPAGQWLDFWTGEALSGGQWLNAAAPLGQIPVYRRLEQPWIDPI